MNNSLNHQFGKVFGWEVRKWFYQLRVIVIPFLIVLLAICLLPYEACQFLDRNLRFLVSLVNFFLSVCIVLGFCVLPLWWISYPYGEKFYNMERASDVHTGMRLLVRIVINLIAGVILYGTGTLAAAAMEKFADAHHSWFQIDAWCEYPYMILIWGLLSPLAYLFFFLRRYLLDHEKSYPLSYVFASFVTVIFRETDLSEIHWGPMEFPYWLKLVVWFVIVFLVSGFFFVRCVQMERKEFEFWG